MALAQAGNPARLDDGRELTRIGGALDREKFSDCRRAGAVLRIVLDVEPRVMSWIVNAWSSGWTQVTTPLNLTG